MTMFLAPYTAIADIDGSPLDAGFLFFGEYGKDPELFPVEIFWDPDFTVPAAQPIRTRNGYPVRNGSPTKVYLKTAEHSIVIKNRNSAFILVDFKNKGWDASFVVDGDKNQKQINDAQKEINRKGVGNYDPSISYVEDSLVIKDGLLQKLTGGVWRPKDPTYYDFGAKIDGVTDDTSAFIAYHTVFKKAQLPVGTMVLSGIDLDQFMTGQTLGLEIEGAGTEVSVFSFTGVGNGFYSGGNRFFRDFRLSNLTLHNRGAAKTKVGFYIGSGGAEQVVLKSVGYNNWKVGRATHCWNSSMEDEIFRYCGIPLAQYGTSTDISNPYANTCDSAYHFGYSCTIDGEVSVPTLPYAYSQLSGFAADHVGVVGNSVYKFGNVSGLTLNSLGTEDARGTHVFDFSEMSNAEIGVIEINNFAMYVQTEYGLNPKLVGICIKPPTNTRSQVVFNNPMISTEKQIYFVSGDGSGIALNNPKMSTRSFTLLTQNNPLGLLIDGVAYGKDAVDMGEIGVLLGANGVSYSRLKNLKGKAIIDPTTQKLVLFCGSLSEGLAPGLMMSAIITAQPLNKNGSNTNEKAGQILISSAMDYNASNMAGHLKTVLTGTLTTATTVTRNMANTTHIQFDVAIEASAATTRMMLDIDLTHNGIGNTNQTSWAIVNK